MVVRILLLLAMTTSCYALVNPTSTFNALFNKWTNDFNQQKWPAVCDLFSKNVIADYRGVPQKKYTTICDGFKKIFADKNRRYQYRFKIHQAYQRDDLAAVRITWYLTEYELNKLVSSTKDEGIDILEKTGNKWRIVNYLAYPVAGP